MKEFLMAVGILVFSLIGLATTKQLDDLIEKPQTNISEYLKSQDEKIIALQKSNDEKLFRIDQLEKESTEDWETFNLFESKLSKAQIKETWKEWDRTICPKYHNVDICKDAHAK